MLSGTDVSVDGSRWSAGASPSLAHLIRDVALKVPHPTDNTRTLWDARHDVGPFDGLMDSESTEALLQQTLNAQSDLGIVPLGSGSDWTAFLQHLGVSDIYAGSNVDGWLTGSNRSRV